MILALETATTACSAALCAADGSVVAERLALTGPAHSQLLLPFVREVLEEAGVGWEAVDTVAVGLGPGAFTGLRIGIATARALAQADGKAGLAGVPTLAAVALALADAPEAAGRRLVPLVDGRRREVFAAVFERDGDVLRQVEEVSVVRADDLAAWLAARGDVLTGGDGAVLYADLLARDGAARRGRRGAYGRDGRPGGRLRRARPRPRPRRGAAHLRPRSRRAAARRRCAARSGAVRVSLSRRRLVSLQVVPDRIDRRRVIRPMQFTDLEAVAALEARTFTLPWSLAIFHGQLARETGICLVCEEAGRVVAYLIADMFVDVWHLMNLCVAEEVRREHVASDLLEAYFEITERKGHRGHTLEVRVSNAPGIELYRSFGFVSTGVRPGYYSDDREDAVIMWKDWEGDSA